MAEMIPTETEELETRHYHDRKTRENSSTIYGIIVVSLMFGIAPMMFGIFTKDLDLAFEGAGFMVLVFIGIAWWQWRTR